MQLGSFSYYGAVADGGIGTISRAGTTSFDNLHEVIGTHVDTSPDSTPPTHHPAGQRHAIHRSGQVDDGHQRRDHRHRDRHRQRRRIQSLTRSGVPAGNIFAIGVTTISWTAIDVFGNQTVVTQKVTVVDTEKPVLTVPAAVTRQVATGGTSIVVTDAELGSASATDNAGSVTIVRTGVPAGNVFPVGTTTITYTATDAAGNVSTGTPDGHRVAAGPGDLGRRD